MKWAKRKGKRQSQAKSLFWWLMCDVIATDAYTITDVLCLMSYVRSSRLKLNRSGFKCGNFRMLSVKDTMKKEANLKERSDLFKMESTLRDVVKQIQETNVCVRAMRWLFFGRFESRIYIFCGYVLIQTDIVIGQQSTK